MNRFVLLLVLVSELALAAPKHGRGFIRQPIAEDTEFRSRYNGLAKEATPPAWDSCDAGLCTPVKNQGSCGSCYTFGGDAAFEAAILKAGLAQSIDLAEQDRLVNSKRDYGCSGGFLEGTFYTQQGDTTEALCPYKGKTRWESCKGAKFAKAAKWGLVGGRDRAPSIEELKAAIVQYGVLTVTVAAGRNFAPKADGRITTCGDRSVNHIVALDGYRTLADGTTEFRIKNSWGKSWGVGGKAWARQGCNKLASSVGDAAMFVSLVK